MCVCVQITRHPKEVIQQLHQNFTVGVSKSSDKVKQINPEVTQGSAFSTYGYGYPITQQYHKDLKVSIIH